MHFGQLITWGALSAPQLFTGDCTGYSYRDQPTRQLDDDAAGNYRAAIIHSRKASVSFSAKVKAGSTDFLDLSAGAAISVTGISAGIVLATRAVERWVLLQPKTCSIDATHFPDMVQADPESAGTDLDAFTPDQSGLSIVTPGATIIWGTFGLGHASGVLHELTLEQQLTISEDDPSPAGTLLGAESHGYMRSITARILSKAAAPAINTVLDLTGAPDHAADYKIDGVDTLFEDKRGKMYELRAFWIPPFAS